MALTHRAVYIGASVGIFISSVVLVILTTLFWNHFRVLLFPSTTCTVHDSIYLTQIRCQCGRGCRALYPCLTIYVHLNIKDLSQEAKKWPVPLYSDDKQYLYVRFSDADQLEPCSLQKCTSDTTQNRDEVESFRKHLGVNESNHTCYYDPKITSKGAFMKRNIHWSLLFHVIFWPCLYIIACVSISAYVFYTRYRDSVKYELAKTDTSHSGIEKF